MMKLMSEEEVRAMFEAQLVNLLPAWSQPPSIARGSMADVFLTMMTATHMQTQRMLSQMEALLPPPVLYASWPKEEERQVFEAGMTASQNSWSTPVTPCDPQEPKMGWKPLETIRAETRAANPGVTPVDPLPPAMDVFDGRSRR
jgi:hypothetical protein